LLGKYAYVPHTMIAINAVKLVRCCLYTPALDISKLTPAVDTQK